ncbi:glycosyltransferase [Pedobacter frigoris]|uniref:Glycosyltransferase family 4 protein n=1 Tax=Pedobacter frigoris TaxID=2571272 RepID=A0A4U1CL98_9SPHI|nr:glycosyltransferase [Pedobacter frigoris]TKC08561.1 glycosyltransferase family 4 protein [Pedobacter frigoris]
MNIKRSITKRWNRLLGKKEKKAVVSGIINFYQTNYQKNVLISYLTLPFQESNDFKHQNYQTAHIVAESFSKLGYNVDVYNFSDTSEIDYSKYSVVFGFGDCFERSFYDHNRQIPRIHFITGAHDYLHNAMSLKSVQDFYALSGLWLPEDGLVLRGNTYYAMFDADFAIILAHGDVLEHFKSEFKNRTYSLNNNILNAFSGFERKSAISRNKNFLFLCGGRVINKGLHVLLEVARSRKDLCFFIIIPYLDESLENHYKDVLDDNDHVILLKNIAMNSEAMRNAVASCSYSITPSYVDGLPGGTIEPMSAGLVPIVSKYCGFPHKDFIFEMEDLSASGLNDAIEKVLAMDDQQYVDCSNAVKDYACEQFASDNVKKELLRILKEEHL